MISYFLSNRHCVDDSNLDLLSKIENEIYSTNKTASFLTNLAGLVSSLERT